jgi:glc operon protein GlcG
MTSFALLCSLAMCFAVATVSAQPTPYGAPLTLDQAKRIVAGAEAEAAKNSWNVVIAILDPGGHLVLLHRMDNTQFGSVEVARAKAYSAVAFRRPTKTFMDNLAQGGENLRILALEGATPVEGGIPIIVDGAIIGGIGVSGVTSAQDAQIGQAGIDALLGR